MPPPNPSVIEPVIHPTPLDRLKSIFPPGQFLPYLCVGVWNTIFGYGAYAAFVAIYSHHLPHKSLMMTVDLASISSTPLAITMAYFCYKFFVFRTQGNYVQEWLRCFAVYGVGMIPGLIILPILTKWIQQLKPLHQLAPYVAGAVFVGAGAILSFLGHKNYSFRVPK